MSSVSDEKKGEKEKIVEVDSIDHFYHYHPLTLKIAGTSMRCYGCRRYIYPTETAYSCREGCYDPLLHKECAEMPREITLSMHPLDHTLIQKEEWSVYVPTCAVCQRDIMRIGYHCNRCEFQVHVGWAQDLGVVPTYIDHPSHPQHQPALLWKPGQFYLSRCDACCTIEKGSSYMCLVCQYRIHESCATLVATQKYEHHHHPLSLIYHLPLEYIKFDITCHICYKDLLPRYWAYHCEICRYIVHIKCATKTSSTTVINIDANAAEDKDVIVLPTNNAVEDLIRSFVIKSGVAMANPNEIVNGNFKFHSHDQQLHLVSTPTQHEHEEENEEVEYDDDGGGLKHRQLACDGCTLPIFSEKQEKSSAYYMSCGECKYFLHWACFHLPPDLPSHPLHEEQNHNLTLQTSPKLDYTYCNICSFHTNGLFYECTKCFFKADIKCASLPNNIKHKSHPHHLLNLLNEEATRNDNYWERKCSACGIHTYRDAYYKCNICEIILHSSCALLPPVVSDSEWDKHPLPLMFDASVDHPSGFYCDVCEQEMNPKRWMYHCRACDFSLHPRCNSTVSGEYRNVKFGQRCDIASEHSHRVTYQLLRTKLRYDVCHGRKDYGVRGFQCTAHNCDFFMCLFPCGRDRKHVMRLVD